MAKSPLRLVLLILSVVCCGFGGSIVSRQNADILDSCLKNTNNSFNLGQVPWDPDIKSVTDAWLSQEKRLKHCPGYNRFPKYGGYCFMADYGDTEYEVCNKFFEKFGARIRSDHPYNTPSACSQRYYANRWYVYCRYAYARK